MKKWLHFLPVEYLPQNTYLIQLFFQVISFLVGPRTIQHPVKDAKEYTKLFNWNYLDFKNLLYFKKFNHDFSPRKW